MYKGISWSMGSLSGVASLTNIDFPSLSSHQLSMVSQLILGFNEPLFHAGTFLACSCAGLMHTITVLNFEFMCATVMSCLENTVCFKCHFPWLLKSSLILEPMLEEIWTRCPIYSWTLLYSVCWTVVGLHNNHHVLLTYISVMRAERFTNLHV